MQAEQRIEDRDPAGYPCDMASAPETQPSELMDRLGRLEDQMRRMQDDLDAIGESRADEEAETLAGERIRSGAAERTRDGAEVLAELGIQTD
jgi:hypothetical protein